MTLLRERVESRQIRELDRCIAAVVEVVQAANGPTPVKDAMRQAARKLNISISQMPYVVNSAVAEHKLEFDLREGTLAPINRA